MSKFHCIHCGQRIDAPDELAGTDANCPTCGGAITVPPLPHTAAPATPPPLPATPPPLTTKKDPLVNSGSPKQKIPDNNLFLKNFVKCRVRYNYIDFEILEIQDENFRFSCGCGQTHRVHDAYAVCELRETSSAVLACPNDDKMLTLVYLMKNFLLTKVKDVVPIASYKSDDFDELYGEIWMFKRMKLKGMSALKEYVEASRNGDY
jgi:DNA-directed RNA polymerase subunit RPC12/RpoP